MSQLWSWGISALGLGAFWIAGSGKRWGWLVGVAQEVVFVAYSVLFRQWGFLVSAFVFMGVFTRNYVIAGRPPKETTPATPRPAGARAGAAQPAEDTPSRTRAAGLPIGKTLPMRGAASQPSPGDLDGNWRAMVWAGEDTGPAPMRSADVIDAAAQSRPDEEKW
jgi:hypothetical protein